MQLPLAIQLNESANFGNYISPDDHFLIDSLKQLIVSSEFSVIYLWGGIGSGKTHLLQAVCHQASQINETVCYLPMAELIQQPPVMLDGLENISVICIDDLQSISGHADWQQAVFHLFNSVQAVGGRIVFSGNASPREMGLSLQDLISRLEWGPVFHIQVLGDDQKIAALKLRAMQRGLELETEPARFLLNRFPRDLNALFEVLDKLDRESLIKQRRLTIPFIREIFPEQS